MRHRRARTAITAAIALAILTGCSSSGGGSGTPAPPAPTSAAVSRPERTAGDRSSPGTAACQAARASVARDTATQWSQQAVDDLARAAQRGGRIDDEVAAVDAAVSSLAGS